MMYDKISKNSFIITYYNKLNLIALYISYDYDV